MRILFLVPYPKSKAPSQRFRYEQYLSHLKTAGHTYKIHSFWGDAAWKVLYQPGKYLQKTLHLIIGFIKRWIQVLFLSHSYQAIFIHREVAPIGPPVFEWILTKIFRKKVIYDFDDAIWLPNTSSGNRIASRLKFHGKTKNICKWAQKVSCGNKYLCNFAKKYNKTVVLNPTTIDTEYHVPIKTDNHKPVIGWTGTHSTLQYLYQIEPVLKELKNSLDFELLIISDIPPKLEVEHTFLQWKSETEIEDLNKIDIGLMPLAEDPWSKGKCGFKALQYMAIETPPIVSPVGVNTEIIDHGQNGFICKTEEDWKTALTELCNNTTLIKDMGQKARNKVFEKFSVHSNSSNFLSLFTEFE